MNEIRIFEKAEFGTIRTMEINNEPWFVGKDIADILEYTNTAKAIRDHVDDEDKLTERIVLSGQNREAILINESGLYSLILSSKMSNAKKFKRWVTSEVLPSIRKHGMYATDELLENPDLAIQVFQKLKEERLERKRLEAENQIMKPKADYFDDLVDRNTLTSFRETAKELRTGERKFINFLLNNGYLYRDKKGKLMPYAEKNNGLFEVKESKSAKTTWSGTQTFVTVKGRETFRLLMK